MMYWIADKELSKINYSTRPDKKQQESCGAGKGNLAEPGKELYLYLYLNMNLYLYLNMNLNLYLYMLHLLNALERCSALSNAAQLCCFSILYHTFVNHLDTLCASAKR